MAFQKSFQFNKNFSSFLWVGRDLYVFSYLHRARSCVLAVPGEAARSRETEHKSNKNNWSSWCFFFLIQREKKKIVFNLIFLIPHFVSTRCIQWIQYCWNIEFSVVLLNIDRENVLGKLFWFWLIIQFVGF